LNIRLYIDYDNVNRAAKNAGLRDLVTRSLLATPVPTEAVNGNCDARIYGGWYEGSILTQAAQKVIGELGRDFPAMLPFRNRRGMTGKCLVTAELACSLEAEPAHHLFNTYRQRSLPRTLKCVSPASRGCNDQDCPLASLASLLDTETCPKNGCSVKLHDVIFQEQQKLVDTMLACDMLHAAQSGCALISLVSSDDDLLPAIRIVLLRGIPFARLHPKTYYQKAAFPPGGAPLVEIQI